MLPRQLSQGHPSPRLVALQKKLSAVLPSELKLKQELMKLLRVGKRQKHRRLLKLRRLVGGPSEKLDAPLRYLEESCSGIQGSRNLRGKVDVRGVLVVASGGIDKNIDRALRHRFEGRGMTLSHTGAQSLLN
jgi:hypothetical protein